MFVIGIVGGIASGKSAVAAQFRELGAEVIDADKLGHLVLNEPAVICAAQDRWGGAVVDGDGKLVRGEIAKRVFPAIDGGSDSGRPNADGPKESQPNTDQTNPNTGQTNTVRPKIGETETELDFWQGVTHPRIERMVREQLAHFERRSSPPKGVVLDAALLFEAGWDQLCNTVIFLEVPREIRLRRIHARGWTEADLDARESFQMALAEKRQKADYVIDNSVALNETYNRVKEIWIRLSS